jgi:hypothetical protein
VTSRVVVMPACDAVDEAALLMLRRLAADHDVLLVEAQAPLSGMVGVGPPAAVVIVSVACGGLTEARYLCRRLRDQTPGLRIVVARLGRRESKKCRKLLLAAGADRVVTTLHEACRRLEQPAPTPSSVPDGTDG